MNKNPKQLNTLLINTQNSPEYKDIPPVYNIIYNNNSLHLLPDLLYVWIT